MLEIKQGPLKVKGRGDRTGPEPITQAYLLAPEFEPQLPLHQLNDLSTELSGNYGEDEREEEEGDTFKKKKRGGGGGGKGRLGGRLRKRPHALVVRKESSPLLAFTATELQSTHTHTRRLRVPQTHRRDRQ